jgi:hypothetical protein
MKTPSRPLALLLWSILFANVVSYAEPRQEQNASASKANSEFRTVPISEWVGERFVFLGRDPELRHYGYQFIYPATQRIGTLPYEKYVGKIVKITRVTPSSTKVSGSYDVEMSVEETGERLRALAIGSNVSGLGPVADIELARSLYLGKTFWRESGSLRVFDERTGKVDIIEIGPLEPLKVIAVTAGWDDNAPVRFVVATQSGTRGYEDVHMSGTNVSSILRDHGRFENEFQLTPPLPRSANEADRSYKPTREMLARAAEGKDVIGWQQSWWGMTDEELVQVFGNNLKKLPKRGLYHGMYANYAIENYRVGTDVLRVVFQMNNKTRRLAQVLISSEEFPTDSVYLSAFERLEELLSQKYGPVRYKQDKNESLVRRERQWVFPTTTIELSYVFIPGVSNSVTIRYFPTASSDANKL